MQLARRAVRSAQSGFTLVELVIVILIVGILAAVVIPTLVDASDEAKRATLKGAAGAIGSAAATQFALAQVNPTATRVTSCTTAASLVTLPSEVTIAGSGTLSAGNTGVCTLTYAGSALTYAFSVMGS